MAARAGCIGFCPFQSFAFGIVFEMHCDQSGDAKATQVFFAHFGAGALGGNHDDREIFTNLHPFFHDVKAVGVREAGALLHQRHHRLDNIRVLLVWREVQYHVGVGHHFFIGAHLKPGLSGFYP